jgi:hypothetical protein
MTNLRSALDKYLSMRKGLRRGLAAAITPCCWSRPRRAYASPS